MPYSGSTIHDSAHAQRRSEEEMASFPKTLRVELMWSRSSRLIAAVSSELPSLLTVGHTIEEIEARLLPSVEALIRAEFGVTVRAKFEDDDDDDDGGDGFRPLAEPRVVGLQRAA